MQETLAHDWRRRMAARSTICAMLLAIPVAVAALIGFSGGFGALPFGISSLANGPSQQSIGIVQPASTAGFARLSASAAGSATAAGPAARAGAPKASNPNGTSPQPAPAPPSLQPTTRSPTKPSPSGPTTPGAGTIPNTPGTGGGNGIIGQAQKSAQQVLGSLLGNRSH